MPFGTKPVGRSKVDFDYIYDTIFEPGVRASMLPETGTLVPHRADKDFYSADINHEMFEYIEYSRIALADISGLNANVLYELGVRHRARECGTAIFRLNFAAPPNFDINHIKAFPYEFAPEERIAEAREQVTRVLTDTLQRNRLDSPPQMYLRLQQQRPPRLKSILLEAENAIRDNDLRTAIDQYKKAVRLDDENPLLHFRLGLLYKDQDAWPEALSEFATAAAREPTYGEAHRELGIAENKLFAAVGGPHSTPGKESLELALHLNPADFDALASLGGIMKRAGNLQVALDLYDRSARMSAGNTYPLLNYLIIKATDRGELVLDNEDGRNLIRAKPALEAQVSNSPPYNAPWSIFDLAEVCMIEGDERQFRSLIEAGITHSTAAWHITAVRDNLRLLRDAGVRIAGLEYAIAKLDMAHARFAERSALA
jgi:tetratricopeptide (TPR) repeat protein